MALCCNDLLSIKFVIFIFLLFVRTSVESETNGLGKRPKYVPNQERTKYVSDVEQSRQKLKLGQLCPRNSPSGCRCWARPDVPNQITYVNCSGTNKDVIPQVELMTLSYTK